MGDKSMEIKIRKTLEVRRDGEAPVTFEGDKIGSVSTRHKRDRWTELHLWRVRNEGVEYVAQQIAKTVVGGEIDRHQVWVCEDESDLRRSVGDGPLARQLYLESGLDGAVDVSALARKSKTGG